MAPHKKKSRGFRSGDLCDHLISLPVPIHLSGKVWFRKSMRALVRWRRAPPCWCLLRTQSMENCYFVSNSMRCWGTRIIITNDVEWGRKRVQKVKCVSCLRVIINQTRNLSINWIFFLCLAGPFRKIVQCCLFNYRDENTSLLNEYCEFLCNNWVIIIVIISTICFAYLLQTRCWVAAAVQFAKIQDMIDR